MNDIHIYITLLSTLFYFGIVDALDLPMLMIEEGLVPDILPNPPTETCDIFYEESDLRVHVGDIVSPLMIQEEPIVTWNISSEDVLHTLVVVGMNQHNHTDYRTKPNQYNLTRPIIGKWLQWVVGNIVINDIPNGNRLISYKAPEPAGWDYVYRYIFLIYEQKEKLDFSSWIFQTKFDIDDTTPLEDFVNACDFDDPIAGSYLVYKGRS